MTRLPRTIVIVGAGFSGTAVAINLLRLSYWKPVRIVLVERAEQMARGTAYADKAYPYLLNVPAGRMSLNSSDPLEFLEFAQRSLPTATADDFLPRPLYGAYLQASLHEAELASPSHVHLHRIHGDVCSIQRLGSSTPFRVELHDGSSFVADDVVLALGNPPPAHIPGIAPLLGSPCYVADPWRTPPQFRSNETALILGTGLSMADTVLAGSDTASTAPTHRALSQLEPTRARSLLDAAQSEFAPRAHGDATHAEPARRDPTHATLSPRDIAQVNTTHGETAHSELAPCAHHDAAHAGAAAHRATTHLDDAHGGLVLRAYAQPAHADAARRDPAHCATHIGSAHLEAARHDGQSGALAGRSASSSAVTFHAISRRGLVPPSQTAFRHAGCDDGSALLRAASLSARRLMRAVRELTDDVQQRGGDWREAITCVRNFAPAIWQRLSTRERKRFLRHARPYWEVHRHRLPQETLTKLHELRRAHKFHVHAGRILNFELIGEKVRVTYRPRGTDEVATLLVDRVINCTGADYNPARSHDPLLRSLLTQGLATSDTLGLGLRTSTHGALIDSHNRVASNLYYIGPMLRADHWECTAAQELRVHAERLAHHLAAPAVKLVPAVARRAPESASHSLVHTPPRERTSPIPPSLSIPPAPTI